MTTEAVDVPAATASFTRDEAALITSVDDAISEVLGWQPAELIGRPSTDFIHPEDQGSAVSAWFTMLNAPGETRPWRGRYHAADGTWTWVETVNVNLLDDPERACVASTMTRVATEQVSAEEELRARTQILSRLSDALPVGLFQVDTERKITFTNDQFHIIIGCPPAATTHAQFSTAVPDDLAQLDAAVSAVLDDQPADDLDIRFRVPASGDRPDVLAERVCVLAMRPLTDRGGKVSGAIGCLSDITERVELRRELELRASIDPVTSCFNRVTTLEVLAGILASQQASAAPTAVMFVDLDRFKQINDRLGHAAGDRVLDIAARRMTTILRDSDRLGRVGGDEFLVICPDVEGPTVALEIGERLARTITADITIDSSTVELRASIGVTWTGEPTDADALVAQADIAMYTAKRSRGARAVLYTPELDLERRTANLG